MSVYGSLYSAVSGIQAQGTAIGIISDNISNINTIGYKAGSQYFSTLVTDSGSTTSYSPGGVRAINRQLVSQQGLLQSTTSPLDIAISGGGFFAVTDGTEGPAGNDGSFYTRAGSFRKDSQGNFVNAAGYYLLAWTLDANGNIPADSNNLSQLSVVNVADAFGESSETTKIDIGANLDAKEEVFRGPQTTVLPGSDTTTSTLNSNLKAADMIIPNANMVVNDSIVFTVTVEGAPAAQAFVYGGFSTSGDFDNAAILGATDEGTDFSTATHGDNFNITIGGVDYNFQYIDPNVSTDTPDAVDGEFTTPEDLVEAINATQDLVARIATNDLGEIRMYVSGKDARKAVSFTDVTGSFATDLGFATVTAAGLGVHRFNTMQGLSDLASLTVPGVDSKLNTPKTTDASVTIFSNDPLRSMDISMTGTGDILEEFGITTGTTLSVPATYDPSVNSDLSIASGNIKPVVTRAVTVYDSQGNDHTVNLSFIKTNTNTWVVEVYAQSATDIVNNPVDERLLASGTIEFNTDGTLKSVESTLTSVEATWRNGAEPSILELNFGTVDDDNGLTQLASESSFSFLNQNGSSIGLLDSVSINEEGFIVANFSNGESKSLYKIPLATFKNPDGLIRKNANVYIQSINSGGFNLKQVGESEVGRISPSSLETSNAELSEELTDMIVAQRAYQASAKVIRTADELLDELNRITS